MFFIFRLPLQRNVLLSYRSTFSPFSRNQNHPDPLHYYTLPLSHSSHLRSRHSLATFTSDLIHCRQSLRQLRRELLNKTPPIFIAHLRLESMENLKFRENPKGLVEKIKNDIVYSLPSPACRAGLSWDSPRTLRHRRRI